MSYSSHMVSMHLNRSITNLDAVGVKRRAEEHVKKEQLSGDVDKIEQLDEDVQDDQVTATTVHLTNRPTASFTTGTARITVAETTQVPTTGYPTKRLDVALCEPPVQCRHTPPSKSDRP